MRRWPGRLGGSMSGCLPVECRKVLATKNHKKHKKKASDLFVPFVFFVAKEVPMRSEVIAAGCRRAAEFVIAEKGFDDLFRPRGWVC